MAESEEELKSLLIKVKEESEKAGLKLNIQKTKIMASGPITSWQIRWGNSHEIKRRLLLGRKVMTNLDSILKSRDITLSTKVHLVKAMVFLVVMYGCESCTIKKAEHWRIGAFELWCWRRLLRVPWTARRSNQSILKEISPGCSLEGLMLKLKLQYFGYLMRRVDSLEKTLMLGGIGGRRTQAETLTWSRQEGSNTGSYRAESDAHCGWSASRGAGLTALSTPACSSLRGCSTVCSLSRGAPGCSSRCAHSCLCSVGVTGVEPGTRGDRKVTEQDASLGAQ